MNVLIVGKTQMGARYCIGGLDAAGHGLRLLDAAGGHAQLNTPFNVGDWWDLTWVPASQLIAPHVEDVLVQPGAIARGTQANPGAWIRQHAAIWAGPPQAILDGAVQRTGNSRGYIDSSNIPPMSTGFWVPDAELTHGQDHRNRSFYRYWHGNQLLDLPYVGTQPLVAVIPVGALVRVSLARWWSPDPNFASRCYLQLSGWF